MRSDVIQKCGRPWERKTRSAMKTKQQVVSEFRRTAIVDAARTVFARKGFARGIMDEIANEAKMAKGTVYLYFRSKKEYTGLSSIAIWNS